MDAYSQLKPAHHHAHITALRYGQEPPPVHVQLILSDLCNQDCGFCAYRMSGGLSTELFATSETHNPNRKIPLAKAIEIVDDCHRLGVKAVQFTGGGEPTVHKAHLDIFGYAQWLGLETALVTNAVLLDPTATAVLAMRWIRVSVDAGTPETYARTRRVSVKHWNRVWSNIETLASGYKGRLGIGFVVTPENYREIPSAAAMAKAHGAGNLRVGAVFSEQGIDYYGSELPEIAETIREAKAAHDSDGFEVVDLFGRRLSDLESGSPAHPKCYYQHFTLYIGADLNLYRCCNTAYTRAGLVGSLKDKRLSDFDLRYEPFDARQCKFCQFRGQNAAIHGLVHEPEDVNFV